MKSTLFSFVIVILLGSLTWTVFPCKAAVVWSDNFNDGNYDGWTVLNGTLNVEDNVLWVESPSTACIVHPSSVAIGTWSFDVYSQGPHQLVQIIGTKPRVIPGPIYMIWIGGDINLYLWDEDFYNLQFFQNSTRTDSARGSTKTKGLHWQHFDITRSSDGRICVYHNGTLALDLSPPLAPSVVTPEFFALFGAAIKGVAIDNIVVSDTVDIEPPPPENATPTPFYMQTWFLLTVGVAVIAIVAIVAFLKSRKR